MNEFDLEDQMLAHDYAIAKQLAYDTRTLDGTYV